MKKRIGWIVMAIVFIMIVGLGGAGNYFYGVAIDSGSRAVDLHGGEADVAKAASVIEEEQEKEEIVREWTEKQSFQPLEIKTDDGLSLKAVYLENEKPNGKTVILAHGYKGNKEQMPGITKFYYEEGYNVLKPDARGHGDSEGDYIGYGWDDRFDYKQWINLLIEEKGADSIILHGFSMGAATVLMTAGEELPSEVKGVIADSSYTAVNEELAHQMKNLYHIPSFPILQVTSLVTNIRAGYTFEEASVVNQVKKSKVPLFFIHGGDDELVPTEMANKLYKAAKGKKELWIVPGATHTEGYSVAEETYQEKITNFIEELSNK
ncbi:MULTISPECIES: alpha/beta hydrolase [Pontibacillus]|uniref:Alpha/beta hydrolase n=1 Tax=Pontibacillus chungwhensis TaxID=265426 RepID=A0ABY8UU91_9BACI|nr:MULTISPECIES: alpha/beta hydrolase [Pontibacillus]MCD5323225.1 alpha/beta hydrolase [Pontibacillus sp. HN14]WIF96612.1 alpha/beta hydrolase [Pontibacillus chungwhensis]